MADPWNWHGVDDDDAYYEEMGIEKRRRELAAKSRRERAAEPRSELAPMPLSIQKQVTKELDKMWWPSRIPF